MNSTVNGKQDPEDVFSEEHTCQQIASLARIPPPIRIEAPKGEGLAEMVGIYADRLKIDLSQRLTSDEIEDLCSRCGVTREQLKPALQLVRQERGIRCHERRDSERPATARERLEAELDRRGVDLTQSVPSGLTAELAALLGNSPQQTSQLIWHVRKSRGIALAGTEGPQPATASLPTSPTNQARTIALQVAGKLAGREEPECLLRAASLLERLLQGDGP